MALDSELLQMDVRQDLSMELEEKIYMKQPTGFESQRKRSQSVYSIYGLT